MRVSLEEHRLKLERESKEFVLVVCGNIEQEKARNIVGDILQRCAKEGKKRALIHVISPLGRPEYLEAIRSIIQENLILSLSIRYAGSSAKELMDLLEKLDNPEIILVGSLEELEGFYDGFSRGVRSRHHV